MRIEIFYGLVITAGLLLGVEAIAQSRKVAAKSDEVTFIEKPQERKVEVYIGGKFFTSYQWPEYIYKPILHPLTTASGIEVTRGYPLSPKEGERVDHPHHAGVWFNHGDVNGHDFWNNSTDIGKEHKGPFGSIKHKSYKIVKKGSVGVLETNSEWLDKDGKVMLTEKTTFSFYGSGSRRYVTRKAELKAETDVVFKDNKEGMFAIRLAKFMEQASDKEEVYLDAAGVPTKVPAGSGTEAKGKYLSSEGLEGDAVWGNKAKWVVMNSQTKNTPVQVAIFDHKSNVGYPSYWHARGYGLFSINPLGAKVFSKGKEELNFSLSKGKSATFTYRIMLNEGKSLSKEEIEVLCNNFSAE